MSDHNAVQLIFSRCERERVMGDYFEWRLRGHGVGELYI